MKVYTKTGDKGKTSLVGGTRVAKSDDRIEAYGEIDELNSWIGLLLSKLPQKHFSRKTLANIQNELFVVGSHVACEIDQRSKIQLPKLSDKLVDELENEIDQMQTNLEELKNFILPGGHELASLSHILRTVSRRVERKVVALIEKENDHEMNAIVVPLNRLSDFFFVLARFFNHENGVIESKWIPKK